jgi:purine-binding chemotaxis protein CheW
VREVLDLQPVSRLANAPPALLGVIEVRGAGVPVVDLRHKLGLPHAEEATEHSRIVVLQLERGGRPLVLGAVTDAVYEVVQLEAGGIEPAPEFGQRWDSGFMRGIARRNDRFVTVLELGRVFGADEFDLGRPGL